MQNYFRLYDYIHEYQRLIYDYYSKHGISFLITYYHINEIETVWDDEKLKDGSYEGFGQYSGMKWDTYLLLPIYFIDEQTTPFDGKDIGYIKENEFRIVFPSTYNIIPLVGDIIKFEQSYLKNINDTYPLFSVTGVEKSVNTDRTFWKLTIKTEQSITTDQIISQLNKTYIFFEYDKKIHTIEDAELLTNLMLKNTYLKENLNNLFDNNSGFYFI